MSDTEDDKKAVLPFHEMGLDDRILKSIAKLGWIQPTLIQVPTNKIKYSKL
jgi:ATP-dependent RNA helicase DDX56/DBP9